MSKTREAFTTPVGRLVQGDCFVPQTKDQQGNIRVYKSGPNIGQPNPQFFIAVAFPKVDPANPAMQNQEFAQFYALLDRVARSEWPALFPNPAGGCVNPLFTMKVKDGDGTDRNGKSNATKEGFAGHWIVSFASAYAPKVVQETSPGVFAQLTDPASVKRGYFVRVAGSATGNDSPNTPGLYVNLDMVCLVAYGQEIISGPDAATAFGQHAALPPGASATPIGGAAMPAGGVPGAPGLPGAPVALPGAPVALPGAPGAPMALPGAPGAPMALPGAPAAPAPGQPAAPGYTGYMGAPGAPLPGAPTAASPSLPAVGLPPSAPAAMAYPTSPPAAPARAMTAQAGGMSYEQYRAAGWTDEQLVAHGFMTA